MTKQKNPYEILGIPQEATAAEIRKAYLQGLRQTPPEKDPEGFEKVSHAYNWLKDTGKRKELEFSLLKKSSGIELQGTPADVDYYFKKRILRFFLASSDLYIQDFSSRFKDISSEVKRLK
jgi:curved DNA-binding protein CbpA